MKSFILSIVALVAFTASAFAAEAIRTNVPAASGSVPGFYVDGHGYFVEAAYAGRATVHATALPEGVNSKELSEVLAYLESVGIDATARLRGDETERKTINGVVIKTTSRAGNGGW